MAWTELYFGQGANMSSKGLGETRTLRADGITVDAAIQAAAANGAYVGASHPRYPDSPSLPGLVANTVSFVPEGTGVRVQIQYVPREFLDPIPPEDTTAEEWIAIDSTFEDAEVEIPIFQEITKSFGEGDAIVEKTAFETLDNVAKFRYKRSVHRITLNATIQGGGGVLTQMAIGDQLNQQSNKIHTINGVKYLFNPDGVRRISVDEYQFTYRWTFDPGITDTLTYDTPSGDPPPPSSPNLGKIGKNYYPHESDSGDFDGFVIGPFRRLTYGPGENPEDLPVMKFSPMYEEVPNGHLGLPGVS